MPHPAIDTRWTCLSISTRIASDQTTGRRVISKSCKETKKKPFTVLSIGVLAATMLGGFERLAHLPDHQPHHLPDLLQHQSHVYQVILVTGDFEGDSANYKPRENKLWLAINPQWFDKSPLSACASQEGERFSTNQLLANWLFTFPHSAGWVPYKLPSISINFCQQL